MKSGLEDEVLPLLLVLPVDPVPDEEDDEEEEEVLEFEDSLALAYLISHTLLLL